METIIIRHFSEFKELLGVHPNSPYCPLLYRGISSRFKLLPTISYDWIKIPERHLSELAQLAQNKFNVLFRNLKPHRNLTEYQLTFLARHFGLISPFMDFTKDITIALQFAFENAQRGSVHIYAINKLQFPVFEYKANIRVESKELAVYRYYLLWDEGGFELGERTQTIQSASLVSQPMNGIQIPFDEKYPDAVFRFEIDNADFDTIVQEVEETGIIMSMDLLLDKNADLFEDTRKINQDAVNEINEKYNLV